MTVNSSLGCIGLALAGLVVTVLLFWLTRAGA